MSTIIDGSASVTINSGAILGITSGTAVASTSGTSIDFTSIPSWVKRITVMFNGVSTNGGSSKLIQIGNGSIVATGYVSTSNYTNTGGGLACAQFTTGFGVNSVTSSDNIYGSFTLSLQSASTYSWTLSGVASTSNSAVAIVWSGGGVSLSGTLDRIRITTVNGTDTFDAGSINILYE